jgi:hypothetical protein
MRQTGIWSLSGWIFTDVEEFLYSDGCVVMFKSGLGEKPCFIKMGDEVFKSEVSMLRSTAEWFHRSVGMGLWIEAYLPIFLKV